MVQHFRKLINLFHKNYSDKLTTISKAIDTILLMARPIIRPTAKPTKQKQGRSANSTNK